MNIKLNVSQKTFEEYLLGIGENYKIKQYNDFTKRIGIIIINDINELMTAGRSENIYKVIFKKTQDILILSNVYLMNNIREDYLKNLLLSGILDLYLEDKNISFTEKQKVDVYKYEILYTYLNKNRFIDEYIYLRLNMKYEYLKRKQYQIKKLKKRNIPEPNNKEEIEEEIKKSISKIYYNVAYERNGTQKINDLEKEKIIGYISNIIDLEKPLTSVILREEYIKSRRLTNNFLKKNYDEIASKYNIDTNDLDDILNNLFGYIQRESYSSMKYFREELFSKGEINKFNIIEELSKSKKYLFLKEYEEDFNNIIYIKEREFRININEHEYIFTIRND